MSFLYLYNSVSHRVNVGAKNVKNIEKSEKSRKKARKKRKNKDTGYKKPFSFMTRSTLLRTGLRLMIDVSLRSQRTRRLTESVVNSKISLDFGC